MLHTGQLRVGLQMVSVQPLIWPRLILGLLVCPAATLRQAQRKEMTPDCLGQPGPNVSTSIDRCVHIAEITNAVSVSPNL